MTAQSSTRNRLLTYYLYRLGRLKYLMILLLLFGFLTFPLYSVFLEGYAAEVLSVVDIGTTNRVICEDLGWKIFAVGVAGGLVVMLIIGLEAFRYLHKKKYVNMDMSLPVNHTQRFFGDLLAMLTAQFVPVFLVCGIGGAISAHVRSLDYTQFYVLNGGTPSYLRQCERLESMIPTFIIASAMLVAMSLFVISFCGRTPVAVIMTIAVQFAIPLSTYCIWIIALSGAYGASSYSVMDTSVMSLLSPLGYLFSAGMNETHRLLNGSPWGYIFIVTYIAALTAGSYFVQKHRRNERTGEPFVYKFARHGFTALYILAVIALFSMAAFAPDYARFTIFFNSSPLVNSVNTDNSAIMIFTGLGAALVIFIIMELIGGGRLKKFPLAAARFTVTAGMCLGLCALMPMTGCFGYSSYVPTASEADRANISFYNSGDYTGDFTVPYEEAAALHKRILEEVPGRRVNPYFNAANIHITFTYLNDSRYIAERVYELNESYARDIYEMYFRNGGFANHYTGRYEGGAASSSTRSEDGQWITVEYPREQFAFLWTTNVRPVDGKNEEDYMIKSDVNVDELMNTMIEEAKATTFEQYYLSSYSPPKYINVRTKTYYGSSITGENTSSDYDNYYRVYPFYTKTVALLKEHGIDLFPDEQPDYSEYSVFLIKPDEGAIYGSVENSFTMNSYNSNLFNDLSFTGIHRLTAGSDELKEIMTYTAEESYYKGKERYYVWVTDGHYGQNVSNICLYPVTEEHTARAAEIWGALPIAQEELDNLHDHGNIFSIEEVEEYDAMTAARNQ